MASKMGPVTGDESKETCMPLGSHGSLILVVRTVLSEPSGREVGRVGGGVLEAD
jgi:hypothetical protein